MSDEMTIEPVESEVQPVVAAAPVAPAPEAVHPARTILERIEADIDSLKSSPHALVEWVKSLIAEAKAKL